MQNPGQLIIAAECGIQIGTGHVMRCLALAQSWRRFGGGVTILLPEGSPGIEQRLHSEGISLQTLPAGGFPEAAVNRVLDASPQAAVLDGYGFSGREQSILSSAGVAVLTVDDYGHATEYPVRWILNQNAGARPEMYSHRSAGAHLLLGTAYALLRGEFSCWLGWKRSIVEKAGKILVTIGGSDPENLSARILESIALLRRPGLQVVLAVGSSNPHLQVLQSTVGRMDLSVRIVQSAVDMPALMAWADVAVSGAGGTAYELCYMGLPSLLFVIAENQRGVAEHLSELSAVVYAGEARKFNARRFAEELGYLLDSQEQRRVLSDAARSLVDSLGADRVRAILVGRELHLRPVRESDCQLLFAWANDPATRSASFHSAPIPWQDHRQWFSERLRDPQSVIYIGETRTGEPVGEVRFHLNVERATLSVVVDQKFRGAGWGRELIAFAIRSLARTRPVRQVDAFVKAGNAASIGLFESTGFRRAGTAPVAGQPALQFIWEGGGDVAAD